VALASKFGAVLKVITPLAEIESALASSPVNE